MTGILTQGRQNTKSNTQARKTKNKHLKKKTYKNINPPEPATVAFCRTDHKDMSMNKYYQSCNVCNLTINIIKRLNTEFSAHLAFYTFFLLVFGCWASFTAPAMFTLFCLLLLLGLLSSPYASIL